MEKKNLLIIGSGGREHALCMKLIESRHVGHISVCPGNAGTLSVPRCENVSLNLTDFSAVGEWCRENRIDLVVVGPEDPLANGIVDTLNRFGIKCFGPSQDAARIESSKAFAKSFMDKYSIPTARWKSFTDAGAAREHILSAPYKALVVKASGLATGKGVIVARDKQEAVRAVKSIMEDREFGSAGSTVVVEELLEGDEVSCLAFCDGSVSACFPMAQDHKRVGEGDTGPNTGGMGAYSPCTLIAESDIKSVRNQVIQRAVDGMRAEGFPYKGVLYAGLMLTKDGPKVLEYNCRFGDPETQVIVPLLRSDLYETMLACVEGTLSRNLPEFHRDRCAVAVVLASGGYPGTYQKGHVISGLDLFEDDESITIAHAGTSFKNGQLVTSGGRVLSVVAHDNDLKKCIEKATKAASKVKFQDAFYRKDIGKRALKKGLSYSGSGVSIEAGNELVQRIKPLARSTNRLGCQGEIGMFAGMFDVKAAGYSDPILVSGTDGVGTKLKIAQLIGEHGSIGEDLVAMCVNDVLVHGAEPLLFLDYFACGRLDVQTAESVIAGVAHGCKLAGCALLGGETAEMPGMYQGADYDLAGFTVGAVERGAALPRLQDIRAGDVIIGVSSSGLHSNGYSLVRKLVEEGGFDYSMPSPFSPNTTLGQSLLTPTKIYVRALLPLLRGGGVKALAHITGGGLLENLPRVLPSGFRAELDAGCWEIPPLFSWLSTQGNISEEEMARTFNCGVGVALVTSPDDVTDVLNALTSAGETAWSIGHVCDVTHSDGEERVLVKNLGTRLRSQFSSRPPGGAAICNGGKTKMKVGVLISGSGTNLQALIDHTKRPDSESAAEIGLVISNVPGVTGLQRAERAGIPTKVISHKLYKSREEFDHEVDRVLREAGVELVCLAGFMRILSGEFTEKWAGRLINVHPSLLPSFKGAHAHKLVLEAGVRISGCTVHFVTAEVDSGAILVQESVPVFPGDTESTLQERIKKKEHVAFPTAMELVASGKAAYNPETNRVVWY